MSGLLPPPLKKINITYLQSNRNLGLLQKERNEEGGSQP
uniref:Uncharacterized protein n=1 Tax=Anguilla anguilla TaxID=7936 RepID=A0A0E9R4P0_ANGAN